MYANYPGDTKKVKADDLMSKLKSTSCQVAFHISRCVVVISCKSSLLYKLRQQPSRSILPPTKIKNNMYSAAEDTQSDSTQKRPSKSTNGKKSVLTSYYDTIASTLSRTRTTKSTSSINGHGNGKPSKRQTMNSRSAEQIWVPDGDSLMGETEQALLQRALDQSITRISSAGEDIIEDSNASDDNNGIPPSPVYNEQLMNDNDEVEVVKRKQPVNAGPGRKKKKKVYNFSKQALFLDSPEIINNPPPPADETVVDQNELEDIVDEVPSAEEDGEYHSDTVKTGKRKTPAKVRKPKNSSKKSNKVPAWSTIWKNHKFMSSRLVDLKWLDERLSGDEEDFVAESRSQDFDELLLDTGNSVDDWKNVTRARDILKIMMEKLQTDYAVPVATPVINAEFSTIVEESE